jgi:hypothetical protein
MDIYRSTPRESVRGLLPWRVCDILQYLTIEEAEQIILQFQGDTWHRNNQVMWSGVPRESAQQWAGERQMETLTTAMGPLMLPEDLLCLKRKKSPNQWMQICESCFGYFLRDMSQKVKRLQYCCRRLHIDSIHLD